MEKSLKPGERIAQCAHAIAEFSIEHPEVFKEWHDESNYICCLVGEDLISLEQQCIEKDILYTKFNEPDYDNQLTAIALEPTQITKKLLSSYKLA